MIKNARYLSIGLMSGTSMDGIDAAILETDGSANVLRELGHCSIAYLPPFKILLKAAEYTVRKCAGDLNDASAYFPRGVHDYLNDVLKLSEDKLTELSAYLYGHDQRDRLITFDSIILHSTQLHCAIVKKLLEKTAYQAVQIDVIGYHGQTLFHQPSHKISVVIGDGQYMADQLSITVVNDFRRRDVMSGGQGAPFAPLYHHALAMRDKKIPLAVINCGGIANLTLITSDNERDLLGFDTGPGNALLDSFVRQRTQGRENMDADGQYAQRGKVDEKILKKLYQKSTLKDNQNYFLMCPPKSLDYGDMTLIAELESLSLEDACATLAAFTADSIVSSLNFLNAELPQQWILTGGGWNNPAIRNEFEQRLAKTLSKCPQIYHADEIGWNSQAMEAQIFAYLAVRSLQNKPISMPGTTRVTKPLSGGRVIKPA